MKVFQMLGPVTFVSELVATYVTLERSFSCVTTIVVLKLAPRFKAFLTNITDKPAFP